MYTKDSNGHVRDTISGELYLPVKAILELLDTAMSESQFRSMLISLEEQKKARPI